MRSLIAFWLLAVAVTAATGSVIALSDQGGAVGGVRVSSGAFHLPFPVFITLVVVSAFGPAIAAVAVTAREAGIHGVRALLGQLLRWRAGVVWYVLALGGPAVFTLLAMLARQSGSAGCTTAAASGCPWGGPGTQGSTWSGQVPHRSDW